MGCIPTEMLYVSETGLLKYIFVSLCDLIGSEKHKKKEREQFDDLHHCLVQAAQCQSERDYRQMSIRNRITNGTKMCSSERVGNCFILLCVFNTAAGQKLIEPGLKSINMSLKKTISCHKLYLGYELWVPELHTINEVHNAHNLVGNLIENIKACFPRDGESGKGWGWNLPKMHAFANMPQNMLKFETARNFSRQIGGQALKSIVKDHAVQTQRRPDKCVEQCAIRECETRQLDFVIKDISIQLEST
jgi:hypothetical protein